MALPVVIAKNQTGSPIFLPRLGLTVPASPATLTLTDFASFYEISWEEGLQVPVGSGDIIINDGSSDLSSAEALSYLDATGNMNGPVTGSVNNAIVRLNGTTGRYTKASGVTLDDSNNLNVGSGTITTTGSINASGGTLTLPTGVTPTPTADGQVYWDTDDDVLRVGNGTTTVTIPKTTDITLQLAYNNSPSIVTGSAADIHFTLTSGGFNVDGAGTINLGGGATAQTINLGTGAGAKTVVVGSTTTTSTTTIASGTGGIQIGTGAIARAVNVGTGAAVQTVTVGSTTSTSTLTAQTGTGAMTFTAGGVFDVNAVGAVTIDSSGSTIGIGTDAVAQAINIGTGAAARTITVGNNTGATALNLTAGTGNVNTTTAMAWNGVLTPASLGANQNDYNPTGLAGISVIRQNSSINVTITGLAGGVSGRILVLTNIGANVITLTNEDVASTAANRFLFGDFIRLFPEDSIILQYDSISARWRAPATSRGSVAGQIKTLFTTFASNAASVVGEHNTQAVGANASINLEARVPPDFNTLISIAAIMIPGATNAAANIDLSSTYAAVGEVFNLNAETNTTITFNLTQNVIAALEASSVASGIAAGDFIGIRFDQNAIGAASNYIGIVLTYT